MGTPDWAWVGISRQRRWTSSRDAATVIDTRACMRIPPREWVERRHDRSRSLLTASAWRGGIPRAYTAGTSIWAGEAPERFTVRIATCRAWRLGRPYGREPGDAAKADVACAGVDHLRSARRRLDIEGLLAPQRAIIVETGNALGLRNERRARFAHRAHELEDRGPCGAVTPARQRIFSGQVVLSGSGWLRLERLNAAIANQPSSRGRPPAEASWRPARQRAGCRAP